MGNSVVLLSVPFPDVELVDQGDGHLTFLGPVQDSHIGIIHDTRGV